LQKQGKSHEFSKIVRHFVQKSGIKDCEKFNNLGASKVCESFNNPVLLSLWAGWVG
jgi:hypothetical protein